MLDPTAVEGADHAQNFRMIGAMLAIAAVLAITSAAPASALKAGYSQFGG